MSCVSLLTCLWHAKKDVIYAWIMHCWIMNWWIAYHKLAQPVSTARESSGILSILSKKTATILSDEIKLNIHSIYKSDEFSRTCPSNKEYVSDGIYIWISNVYMSNWWETRACPEQILLFNLKELHIEYLKRHGKWCISVVESLAYILFVYMSTIRTSSC